ncbi:thyrotropin releasing hormone [Lacerta agilis]|uniref:thyrotropin releasing hormone n=1 Tax=Lacerta agilis TaxID=80427 RepID=UPI0014193C13|nr:thyrotropin releasing hormone [Lacerta agilis]
MTSVQRLLLLLSLAFASICVNVGQPFPEGVENEGKSNLDGILQRAENIILKSILKKVDDDKEDPNKEPGAFQPDWISKRQHPGKRSLYDLEKKQHPGKREDVDEESYGETMKRQHPGKREEEGEFDPYLEVQKRQHPGRRYLQEQYLDLPSSSQLAYLDEFSKRQHPGRRYLTYSKRQHPGKRSWEEEIDEGEQNLEKRQHPGKRYLVDAENPDYTTVPCEPQDSFECSKGSLLLELLDNVSKGRVDEKRQHPGRRSSWDGAVEEEE